MSRRKPGVGSRGGKSRIEESAGGPYPDRACFPVGLGSVRAKEGSLRAQKRASGLSVFSWIGAFTEGIQHYGLHRIPDSIL